MNGYAPKPVDQKTSRKLPRMVKIKTKQAPRNLHNYKLNKYKYIYIKAKTKLNVKT